MVKVVFVKYKKGYKYQLSESFEFMIPRRAGKNYDSHWITFREDGLLTIREGYAWDGPSGPTFDTPNTMTPSLVHDALYQLMRMGLLPQSKRSYADELMRVMLIERGMSWFRAWAWYHSLRWGARKAALPESRRKVVDVQ